ncbi:MAG: alpha-ketoglutarate-dependent dioxygenase AlkB [Acidimicrobiales bacterium]|nr:alpha-ketoglutarate-dependent dioxygenase AlkB [Acidimicrobiales bacterium]MYA83898.1 alpha-ketoglutarate-dependent dioxygenase AlkB [Acidimicrobiales bacterium]MYD84268.1 alpha-ketoglutarate-dependent dioxygenase AlkB [Acidimicrobiales bacterium]MYH74579.1 alpha-ketoglutarate-dependent dioxygenase AlkB [Acidimicrobiales bacterium]MYJ64497.1 alpha-ketoglutarate-dependent dioxygenase AlkB [Acidimicrobiales bacterium]
MAMVWNRTAVTAGVGDYQTDLFALGTPQLNPAAAVVRTILDDHSWIDASSRWLSGADELLADLAQRLRWTRAQREMYGRMVEEPRLGAQLRCPTSSAPRAVNAMSTALGDRYGKPLNSVWVNYYRDGRDSVAWHSDRIGINPDDSLVAIVSLGGPRRFLLRPKGGGRSRAFTLASGDLLVMGGACQRSWEHSVPKTATASPRMSVTFRHSREASRRPERGDQQLRT